MIARVSVRRDRTSVRDDECAGEQRANAAPDDLPFPMQPEGADVTILSPAQHEHAEATDATVARLQHLLAEAIKGRDWAVSRVLHLERHGLRHWFVDDGNGYCEACALPAANGRHAPREAAL